MRLHQTGWKRFLKDNFSCIVIDELFSKGPEKIAVGDINGRVYLFDTVADHQEALETKGGPIQSLTTARFLNLDANDQQVFDLVASDSDGNLFCLSRKEILSHRSFGFPIHTVVIDRDAEGRESIVIGNSKGDIEALEDVDLARSWRISLPASKSPLQDNSVAAMASIFVPDIAGTMSSYLVVSDYQRRLYFIRSGVICYSILCPDVVTTMCSINLSPNPRSQTPLNTLFMGLRNGSIYSLSRKFELKEFANVGREITQILSLSATLPAPECTFTNATLLSIPSTTPSAVSLDNCRPGHHPNPMQFSLVCAGHFPSIKLFQVIFEEGEVSGCQILDEEQPDWVTCMSVSHSNLRLVVGRADNSIELYNVLLN